MDIIFSRDVADSLKDRFTVLELETFDVNGQMLETFCVVPADKIPIVEMPTLEKAVNMHEHLAKSIKQENWHFCVEAIPHLMGKFGGELDSFYEIILEKATVNLANNPPPDSTVEE